MKYDPAVVTNPANYSLCYYDESLGLYAPVESWHDETNHTIGANVTHFSPWGIFNMDVLGSIYTAANNFNRGIEGLVAGSQYIVKNIVDESTASTVKVIKSYNADSSSNSVTIEEKVTTAYSGSYAKNSQPNPQPTPGPSPMPNPQFAPVPLPNVPSGNVLHITVNSNSNTNWYSGYTSPSGVYRIVAQGWHTYWQPKSSIISYADDSNTPVIFPAWCGNVVHFRSGSNDYRMPQLRTSPGTLELPHQGGSIGVWFNDNPYWDNSADLIYALEYKGAIPVTGIDTDEDGLPDDVETNGYSDGCNRHYTTLPNKWDTDEDGLSDGEEAGVWTENNGMKYFNAISDPMLKDRDDDGLWDDEELEIHTNPFYYDTDFDLMSDKDDPEPLTPIYISIFVNDLTVKRDVMVGAVFGDTGDIGGSFHWLVGDMSSSPYYVVGAILSGFVVLGDIRDTLQSIVNMDALGTALNGAAFIPGAGDALKASSTIGLFIARHADDAKYAGDLAKILSKVFLRFMPDDLAKPIFKLLTNGASERLGLDPATLNKLVDRGVPIDQLGKYTDIMVNAGSDPTVIKEFMQKVASDDPDEMLKADLSKTIKVMKNGDEQIRWLEEGMSDDIAISLGRSSGTGWQHIKVDHGQDFKDAFGDMSDSALRDLVFACIQNGKKYLTKDGKEGFEYFVPPTNKPMFVVVGKNGFIQSARPGVASNVIK